MSDTLYVCNGCGKASDKPRPACPKCGDTRWVKLVLQDKGGSIDWDSLAALAASLTETM